LPFFSFFPPDKNFPRAWKKGSRVFAAGEPRLGKKEKRKKSVGQEEKKEKHYKTPSLFCSSCCVAKHPPTAPIESQQKILSVGCFGMVCDREPAVKKGGEKHVRKKREKKTHSQNAKSFFVPLIASPSTKNSTNRKPANDF